MNKITIEIKDGEAESKIVMPYYDEDATIYDMEQTIIQALLGIGYPQEVVNKILIGEQ